MSNWTIRRMTDTHRPFVRFVAVDGDEEKATIEERGLRHQVKFNGAPALNWECDTIDKAHGFLRGVERAAQVHAKETRTAKGT